MKHEVATLDGVALDAAVAEAEGLKYWVCRAPTAEGGAMWIELERESTSPVRIVVDGIAPTERYEWSPRQAWEHGGPIIERERIAIVHLGGRWCALMPGGEYDPSYWLLEMTSGAATPAGPTPLVAAMRACVASKFGDTVDLELL